MILYPAIDLKDGQCVRLIQGDMQKATVFNERPADQARQFEQIGFRWLHIVDLDGAIKGQAVNAQAIEDILKRVAIPVQLGGGIRDRDTAVSWLQRGIARIILGTAAVERPKLVEEIARDWPGRVAVGIDARAGLVSVQGWAHGTQTRATDLARSMENAGAATIIYTDIARDGTGLGLNIEETLGLAESVQIPVIASGGVSGIADLEALMSARDGADNVAGVVIGRALYDGRLDARSALQRIRG